jgi:hypothetical protein
MRVRIEFDSRRGRLAFRWGVALAVAALAMGVPLYASQVGAITTFHPGDVITSSAMNANFAALSAAIDDTDNKCGVLSNLTTTTHANLVAAVNEVNAKTGTSLTSVATATGGGLTGNGTTATPLAVNFTSGETTYDGRYLQSVPTGAGLTGNGTTATPLAVNFASGETTYDARYLQSVAKSTGLTGNGTTATPLAVNFASGETTYDARYLQSVATGAGLAGNGATATPLAVDFNSGETTYDGRYLLQNGADTLTGSLDVVGPVSVLEGLGTGKDAIFCQGGSASGANPGGRALVAVGGTYIGPGVGPAGTAIDATAGTVLGGGNAGLAAAFHGDVTMNGDLNASSAVLPVGVLTIMDTSGYGNVALAAKGGTPPAISAASAKGNFGGNGGNIDGGTGGDATGSGATTGGQGGAGLFIHGGDGGAGATVGRGGVGVDAYGGGGGEGGDAIHALGQFGDSVAGVGIVTEGGQSSTGTGGVGILARGGLGAGSVLGPAGQFFGDVSIVGNLSVNGTINGAVKPWKIDHPLDPDNKFLYHVAVESPDMMNVYNGVVVLDEKGEATVELPSYFEALNRDFRYQLTCICGAALVYISEEIHANRFSIAGGKPGLKVSWQVTGIRQDAYANAHRIVPEVEKSPTEKGKLLFPVELGRPASDGINLPPRGASGAAGFAARNSESPHATASTKAPAAPAAAKHD